MKLTNLALIPLALAALLAPLSSRAAAGPLADREETVAVKANTLPAAFQGAAIETLAMFSSDGQNLRPIPFQVDEIAPDGSYILKGGKTPAGTPDGKLDGKDELVFMAFDAGVPHIGAPAEGCDAFATITLTDPTTNVQGFALLAKCQNLETKTKTSYLTFDPVSRMAATDAYRFGYSKQYAFFYDYLAVGKGPDVLDRLKIRASLGKFGVDYTFNEEKHFDYTLIGHHAGPVRAIIKSANKFALGPFGLIDIGQTVLLQKDYIILLNLMDTRLNPAALGLDFRVEIGHDLTLKEDDGYRICTSTLPVCQNYKDKLTPQRVKELTEQTMLWGGFDGPNGPLISYFVPDPRLPTKVHAIYLDDPNLDKAPEEIKGSKPLLSFNVIDWKNAKPDVYSLDFYHFFPPKYSPEEVERFARMIKSPLKVTAQ